MHKPLNVTLLDQIEAALPQTQCGKCQTLGCRPYAEAILAGTPINRCVPGGVETIADLAQLMGRPVIPLDPEYGMEPDTHRVAFIREDECIGCTKCIQACPVDAIVGAAKLMHTVITAECSGCDLCIPACPVDCIDVHHSPKIVESDEKMRLKRQYKKRFEAREQRLYRIAESKKAHKEIRTAPVASKPAMSPLVAAALIRSQLKKAERQLLLAQEKGEAISALQSEILALQKELAAVTM